MASELFTLVVGIVENYGITDYRALPEQEKRNLVAAKIRDLPFHDKIGILVDADREFELPDLLANAIENPKSFGQVAAAIDRLFINGFASYEPFFEDEISELLAETKKWQAASEKDAA